MFSCPHPKEGAGEYSVRGLNLVSLKVCPRHEYQPETGNWKVFCFCLKQLVPVEEIFLVSLFILFPNLSVLYFYRPFDRSCFTQKSGVSNLIWKCASYWITSSFLIVNHSFLS